MTEVLHMGYADAMKARENEDCDTNRMENQETNVLDTEEPFRKIVICTTHVENGQVNFHGYIEKGWHSSKPLCEPGVVLVE